MGYIVLRGCYPRLFWFKFCGANDLGMALDLFLHQFAEFLGAASIGLVTSVDQKFPHFRHLQRLVNL